MSDCGCGPTAVDTVGQRRVLKIALALNATMFLVEIAAGSIGHSLGLIADGLDMLADASAYAIALAAIHRGLRFKSNAALASGLLLLLLGVFVLGEAVMRVQSGEAPEGLLMIGVAVVAALTNATVLRLLSRHRDDGVHLRATWIFTRVDVIANVAVVLSGIAVLATGIRYIDLAVGTAIGLYICKEASEILSDARKARAVAR